MNKKNLIPISIIGIVIVIGLIYLFSLTRANNSDYFNEKTILIDKNLGIEIDASKKTEKEVQDEIQTILNNKNIELIQKDEVIDTISFEDANVEANLIDAINRAKKMNDQISGFDKFNEHTFEITIALSVEEENFGSIADNLNCLTNFTEASDAYIVEENCEMKIVSAENGTVTSKEKLIPYVVSQFNNGNFSINLDEGDIYDAPETTTENKALAQRVEIFNKTVNTDFTYLFGEETVKIPKETIYSWISLSDTNKIIFDESAMAEYIKQLAQEYNTIKLNRTFTTTNNKTITIPYASYGWKIDEKKELSKLKSDLSKGGTVEREPQWSNQGWENYTRVDNNDFGDSYIEIDITTQTLWFYLNDEIIVKSDIVSGTKNAGHLTSSGAHKITKKVRDSILTGQGEDKEGEVQYAVFFDNEKAIHDTSLRTEFGGDIYITDGTRGCINVPFDTAKIIYEQTDINFPIIIYNSAELEKVQ